MIDWLITEPLQKYLKKLDYSKIYEIRLRRNCPIIVNYRGKNITLTYDMTPSSEKIYATPSMIEQTIKKATENSLYAYNSQLKQGFITARGGIRIGVAGESVVGDNFLPTTIKNINSLNIRIPHEVIGCSKIAFKFLFSKENGIKNTLVISPPGAGKTTFLRDIARNLSQVEDVIFNVLVVDERFEIASCVDGLPMLDVGVYTDVVSGASKNYGFVNGIRVLKPDAIITDELITSEDAEACINAINSGVKVIASIHAKNHIEVMEKKEFKQLINGRYFERIVILSNKNGPGTYEAIYDQDLNCLYF